MRISSFGKCSEWHVDFSLILQRHQQQRDACFCCVLHWQSLFLSRVVDDAAFIGPVFILWKWNKKPCTGFHSRALSREKTVFARDIYVEDEGRAAAVMMYGIISHQLQSKQAKSARQFTSSHGVRCCYKMCTIFHNANRGSHPQCPSLLLLLTIALHCISTSPRFIFSVLEAQESCPVSSHVSLSLSLSNKK